MLRKLTSFLVFLKVIVLLFCSISVPSSKEVITLLTPVL